MFHAHDSLAVFGVPAWQHMRQWASYNHTECGIEDKICDIAQPQAMNSTQARARDTPCPFSSPREALHAVSGKDTK